MAGFPHFSLTGSSTPFADVTTSILDVDVNVRFLTPKFQFCTRTPLKQRTTAS